MLRGGVMKVTDLSHVFNITDSVCPDSDLMSWVKTHNVDRDGYNLTMVTVNSHAGTHTDAPLHFIKDGKALSEVPIERYVGPCFVADCRAKGYPNAMIMPEDVMPYEAEIKKAGRVILATGWGERFNTEQYFYEYPSVSLELCDYLMGLGVGLIGVEGPSMNNRDGVAVHQKLLGSEVLIMEGVCNTEELIGKEIIFCCAPLKFEDLDGFPVRAFAIEL